MDEVQEVVEALKREHGRHIVDIVVTLNDRTWKRAWLYGFTWGIGVAAAIYGLARSAGWL